MGKSTSSVRRRKPAFPLWLHSGTGQWTKKIRGKHYYFGCDKDAALKEYLRVADDLRAGRQPPPVGCDLLTIKRLADTFLTHKKSQVTIGELTQRSFEDYEAACQRMADFLGKNTAVERLRPDDLLKYRQHMGEKWGASTIGVEVTKCRVVLRFAFENGLIDHPVRFGEFKKPAKSASRRQRTEVDPRMFTPSDLRAILEAADVHVRAMICLGINCGFGNCDCGTLPKSALDLQTGWIEYPRPKTGIARRCPLWPETVQALRASIALRPVPEDDKHAGLVFVMADGDAWYGDNGEEQRLSHAFRKLLKTLELHRPGLSFYSLRHCFQTVADEVGDYIATKRIMGHADNSISDHYRERFQDERLRKVVNHVHGWLFGQSGCAAAEPP